MKELIVVGGANGTGKTTFALEYARLNDCLYLGADAIASELSPKSPESAAVRAGEELMRRLSAALEASESLVVESTLAGRTLRHTIRKARSAGFMITIVYLYLANEGMCVERVRERVQKGGHSVPEVDIRRRFWRSLQNFWTLYRPLADHWLLVYNSDRQPLDVAVGTGGDISVRDAELFTSFQQLISDGTNG